MEHKGVSYPEALKIIARKYNIEVQENEMTREDVRRNNDRESMFALNSWAAEYFAEHLRQSEEGMAYFSQQRGFMDATIKKFGLGMCPAQWDKMTQDAITASYCKEFLLSTGLTAKSSKNGKMFDRFRERVMFPMHNISGRIVAFAGRTLRVANGVGKYVNSPASQIFNKSNELYGLFFAKRAIQQQDFAILVEGYADVISMHQAGIENVVASLGTALTKGQIQLLGRFTKNITVIYDGDSPGILAALRSVDLILKEGMNVRILLLPEGEDPDSFVRTHSASEVQAYIAENQENFITFKAKVLMQDAANDPIRCSEVITDIVQSIALISDNIQRAVYADTCARIMGIDKGLIISEVNRIHGSHQ